MKIVKDFTAFCSNFLSILIGGECLTIEEAVQQLENLRQGKTALLHIHQKDFLVFRQELIKQPDFKRFRGIARHGGNIDYEYMEAARS